MWSTINRPTPLGLAQLSIVHLQDRKMPVLMAKVGGQEKQVAYIRDETNLRLILETLFYDARNEVGA